jgi:hypothetical protein
MAKDPTQQQPEQPERGPAPADNPEHDACEECDPTPAKDPKGASEKPPCPEGYADRQPTLPPAEEPEQRGH